MEAEGEAMDLGVPSSIEEDKMDTSNAHWNAEVVESIKAFLLSDGTKYPDHTTKNMRRNFRKRANDFEVVEGQLFYKKSGGHRLVLSCREEWSRVFQECHQDPSGGHMGRTKTVEKLKKRYYWPNQYIYVVEQIKNCDRCQRTQPVLQSTMNELHPIPVSPEVWNLVGMDLIGPLKVTPNGNQYILTMTCYFSKWVEAFPLKDKTAWSIAQAIYSAYCRHGAPCDIISDQGREFINQVTDTLHSEFKVKQRITAAYHPQSNGLDERTNQTIKRSLVKMVGEKKNDWDNYLDPVLFGIRTSVQESTKFTPFFLMHGREARFPFEAENAPSVVTHKVTLVDLEKRIDCMNKLKDSIFPVVKANIDRSQKKQKQQYQKRKGIVKTNVKVNDLVLRLNMLKRTKKGHKMEDTWKGPYRVRYMSEKGSCLLHCTKTGKDIKQKVNISQLKLYNQTADIKTVNESAEENDTESYDNSTNYSSTTSSRPALSGSSSHMLASNTSIQKPIPCSSTSSLNSMLSSSSSPKSTLSITGPKPILSITSPKPILNSSSPKSLLSSCSYQVIALDSTNTELSLKLPVLKKQLFDDSILRLWRTGCLSEAWERQEDDLTKLGETIDSGEYGLSIDPDVRLWLDFRSFSNQSCLKVIDDFVIVSTDIHNEFAMFKESELAKFGTSSSLLAAIELLQLWLSQSDISVPIQFIYGKKYVSLTSVQLDDLCAWVRELRTKVMARGDVIFQELLQDTCVVSKTLASNLENKGNKVHWVQSLDLRVGDKLSENSMLTDKHMYAALKLLKKQFPTISGLQPTILCQNNGFCSISVSIQIHYTGQTHWVTSAYVSGEVILYDSCVSTKLTHCLKLQLKQIYQVAITGDCLNIIEMPVQQQLNGTDCGLFSIAFAYHIALGDEPSALNFNASEMRQHVIQCFEDCKLSPFPQIADSPARHCKKKIRTIKF